MQGPEKQDCVLVPVLNHLKPHLAEIQWPPAHRKLNSTVEGRAHGAERVGFDRPMGFREVKSELNKQPDPFRTTHLAEEAPTCLSSRLRYALCSEQG